MSRLAFGLLAASSCLALPLTAQQPGVPSPQGGVRISQYCADDTGCPFPGAVIPHHLDEAPVFPASAAPGTVQVRLVVTVTGDVDPASVRVSGPDAATLGDAVAAAARNWKFVVLGEAERPANTRIPLRITVDFQRGSACTGATRREAAWTEHRSPRLVVTDCGGTSGVGTGGGT